MTKAERSRNMRYKKPSLAEFGYSEILDELCEIRDACGGIRWLMEDDNEETLLNALDGDEEDEYEFRMMFSILEAECEQLYGMLTDNYEIKNYFDDCTVALIGNRFNTVGFDGYEEDYYSLTNFDQGLAFTEAGKRVMRMTKAEMLSAIGQCMGIVLSYQNVRLKYDYLKATFDILRDENTSILQIIREIETAYEAANSDGFYEYDKSTKDFERLINELPDKIWVE